MSRRRHVNLILGFVFDSSLHLPPAFAHVLYMFSVSVLRVRFCRECPHAIAYCSLHPISTCIAGLNPKQSVSVGDLQFPFFNYCIIPKVVSTLSKHGECFYGFQSRVMQYMQ